MARQSDIDKCSCRLMKMVPVLSFTDSLHHSSQILFDSSILPHLVVLGSPVSLFEQGLGSVEHLCAYLWKHI